MYVFIGDLYVFKNNITGVLGGTRALLKCWFGFMLGWLLPFWGHLYCVFVTLAPNGGVWALRMVLPLICLDHLSACYFWVLFCFVVSFSFLFVVRMSLCLLLRIVCVLHCVFCCVWQPIIIINMLYSTTDFYVNYNIVQWHCGTEG